MRRQFARWSFFLFLSLSLLSLDGFAESSVAKCLDARLYWESFVNKLDPHADVLLLDQAAMSLFVRGRSFGVRSFRNQDRENGNMFSAAATFRGVVARRDEFIPSFQVRLKQLSDGKAELISISPQEAGGDKIKSNSSYFKLIRQTSDGPRESYVTLTQEGFSVLPPAETKAKKVQAADIFEEPVKRSWARGAMKQRIAAPTFEKIGVSSEESQKFWNSLLNATKSGESAEIDAYQYDRAAISLSQGQSYGVATFRDARLNGDLVKSAFARAESASSQFIPKFQDRVYQLSLGKAQLTPISAKEAGFDIVGTGKFFKLVWHSGRVKQESVVWLTSDGVSVYPMPGISL